jgi:hypothetical protein
VLAWSFFMLIFLRIFYKKWLNAHNLLKMVHNLSKIVHKSKKIVHNLPEMVHKSGKAVRNRVITFTNISIIVHTLPKMVHINILILTADVKRI